MQACDTKTEKQDKQIPIEVAKLKETGNFDTLIVIQTDENIYVFNNKSHDYVSTIEKEHVDGVLAAVVILLLCVLCFVLAAIL